VRSQLVRDYGNARNERMKRIALIGLRGAGKSTRCEAGTRARRAFVEPP